VSKFVQQLLGERDGYRSRRAAGERCIGQRANGIDGAGTTAGLDIGQASIQLSNGRTNRLRGNYMKKILTLVALTLLAAVVISEVAFASKCPPGQRFYNGRCV
jgi:hypothetical protein